MADGGGGPRIEDERFYPPPATLPWPPPQSQAFVPERTFYAGTERPPREPSFFERVPARVVPFGALLFFLGWLGILFQRGLLRQLVVGAPIFEELAKLGLALVVVGALAIRAMPLRVPFGWASGAGCGVLEHFLTSGDEEPLYFALRVAFHAATAGLSIAVFTLVEPMPDPRVRWASTLASSALHAANNLGALVLALLSLVIDTSLAASVYSLMITSAALALTLLALGDAERARAFTRRQMGRIFSTLNPREAALAAPAAPGPHGTWSAPPEAPPRPPQEPPGP